MKQFEGCYAYFGLIQHDNILFIKFVSSRCQSPTAFEVQTFWKGSSGLKVLFWLTNMGMSELEVRQVQSKMCVNNKYVQTGRLI